MNKILIVGCGHMGSALLSSWIKKTSFKFTVVDPKNYSSLKKKFPKKIKFYKSFNQIKSVRDFDVIVFAIKPQVANKVIKAYSNLVKKNILLISIIAGKQINFLQKSIIYTNQIVRVMPNMPALVERGTSCLVSSKSTSFNNKKISLNLFEKVGTAIWLKKESDLDKITAISGSGPAYYFLFIYYLEMAAYDLGLSKKIAKELVYKTAYGSLKLLEKDSSEAKDLKNKIAVKGGTTEAAIKVFEKNNSFKNIIHKAIKAAYSKSKKLSK